VHWFILVLTVALVTIFLTELTSNTATASMLLPIVAGLAAASGQDALLPMVATALAASFAFMLPVATPPNAIVFASRQVTIAEMARAGIWMNLIGLLLIALAVSVWLPLVWGISP
jgi:sodium-dependent dicarboxylate transporter 2/3/5